MLSRQSEESQHIVSPEDLPKPTLQVISRSRRGERCPQCRRNCYRDAERERQLYDVGSLKTGRPHLLKVTYSIHRCEKCKIYFSADMSDLAAAGYHYTHRVTSLALRAVLEDGLPYQSASWRLLRDHCVFVPWATIQNWVEGTGKKRRAEFAEDYEPWALDGFSGYLAADEVYDGPFGVLFAVDSKRQRRLAYEVLDHSPTKEDIERFLRRVDRMLTARGLAVAGITTDGSPLYPDPIRTIWPNARHQICEFHVIKEINKDVLRVVAKLRKSLAAKIPKLSHIPAFITKQE